MIPEILSAYKKLHANVKFQLNQNSNREIVEQLKSRHVDLALMTLHHYEQEIVWQPLITEELFLIVSVDHPLATYHEIDLNMAKNEPFISFKNVNELQTIITELCKSAGFTPDVVFEGEDIGTVSGLVGAKLGVSLVPDIQIIDKIKVKLIRVKQPICKREIGIAWLKDSYTSPVVNQFIRFIQRLFEKRSIHHK